MVEVQHAELGANLAESVHIHIAGTIPVTELDTQFDGALGLAQHLVLIKSQQTSVQANLGNGGLTNADDADFIGFNQFKLNQAFEKPGQRSSRHPAGGTASNNNYFPDGLVADCSVLVRRKPLFRIIPEQGPGLRG